MKITCTLGRIAPVTLDPQATLKGDQNSKRWILDIEYDGRESAMVPVKLLDYRTGKPITPMGLLNASYAPLNRAAARALVYFHNIEDDKLFVAVEPHPDETEAVHVVVTVDAIHTLMR